MATTKGPSGSTGYSGGGNYKSGMTKKSPPAVDASFKRSGGSVNDRGREQTTAPTPRTLGPRDA